MLWEKFSQYEAGSDFGTWATSVAHYGAYVNFLRRQSQRRTLFSATQFRHDWSKRGQPFTIGRFPPVRGIETLPETLSSNHRRLLMLRYHGEYSMQQIAKQESRSVGALYRGGIANTQSIAVVYRTTNRGRGWLMDSRDLITEINDLALRASDDRLSPAARAAQQKCSSRVTRPAEHCYFAE